MQFSMHDIVFTTTVAFHRRLNSKSVFLNAFVDSFWCLSDAMCEEQHFVVKIKLTSERTHCKSVNVECFPIQWTFHCRRYWIRYVWYSLIQLIVVFLVQNLDVGNGDIHLVAPMCQHITALLIERRCWLFASTSWVLACKPISQTTLRLLILFKK